MKIITLLSITILLTVIAVDGVNINKQKSIHVDTDIQGFTPSKHTCIVCTLLLSLVEQYSVIHDKSIDGAMQDICSFLPKELAQGCKLALVFYGPQIVKYFQDYQHADDVCHAMQVCTNPQCRLFGNETATFDGPYGEETIFTKSLKLGKDSPWDWIMKIINQIFDKFSKDHLPADDSDGDFFSFASTLRGYNWRGRDCNDFDKSVYPGVISNPNQPNIDWNCNGIYGVNSSTGVSYEDELCSSSGAMGTIVIGDSAGAHFSIPPQWLTASQINSTTYKGMLAAIEDELDWPHRSSYTGYVPSSPDVPVDSIYLRLRERNLCNHRDYQNTGVNGADSFSVALGNIKTVARNQTTDNPVLFFLELIGNDVCSGRHDLSHMTTVEEFTANTLQTLSYLDTILPMGSHVVFIGLADGRVLWDSLWNRTHPIGATYEQVYNFLNCLGASPCWGWMNPDESIRNATSERAAQLSLVYNQIIQSHSYKHFDMQYYDFPFPAINEQWIAQGGETWQLIEAVDGFHPNQIANYLIAGELWDQIMQDHPDWLGEINPNNLMIQQTFGNQGGY